MSKVRDLLRRADAGSPAPASAPSRPPREPGEPVRVAAITVCRDERAMLPRWLRYYGSQLGTEHLYVVDDSSVDGSTDDLPCDVVHLPPVRGGKFETTRMGVLAGLSSALLQLYDAVLFTDADEFVVPDPALWPGGLREFVEKHEDVAAVGVLGLNVVHAVAAEPPLDPAAPVLGQRRLAKMMPLMCKPSLKLVAAPWYAASHGIRAPYRVDPGLWMFHLKFADRDLLREAADRRQAAVQEDGRSRATSWRRGGEEMVGLLDEVAGDVTDVGAVPELRPPDGAELAALVKQEEGDGWRARTGNQVNQMRRRPLVRIPERFYGLV